MVGMVLRARGTFSQGDIFLLLGLDGGLGSGGLTAVFLGLWGLVILFGLVIGDGSGDAASSRC